MHICSKQLTTTRYITSSATRTCTLNWCNIWLNQAEAHSGLKFDFSQGQAAFESETQRTNWSNALRFAKQEAFQRMFMMRYVCVTTWDVLVLCCDSYAPHSAVGRNFRLYCTNFHIVFYFILQKFQNRRQWLGMTLTELFHQVVGPHWNRCNGPKL
jgi:hypothetical protein